MKTTQTLRRSDICHLAFFRPIIPPRRSRSSRKLQRDFFSIRRHGKLVSLQFHRTRGKKRKNERKEERGRGQARLFATMCAPCTRYALVLEMHWRLGANHNLRRRGVSGAARRNILPPAGRRSCWPADPDSNSAVSFFSSFSFSFSFIALSPYTVRYINVISQRDRARNLGYVAIHQLN